jgi:hypothetical protein
MAHAGVVRMPCGNRRVKTCRRKLCTYHCSNRCRCVQREPTTYPFVCRCGRAFRDVDKMKRHIRAQRAAVGPHVMCATTVVTETRGKR